MIVIAIGIFIIRNLYIKINKQKYSQVESIDIEMHKIIDVEQNKNSLRT